MQNQKRKPERRVGLSSIHPSSFILHPSYSALPIDFSGPLTVPTNTSPSVVT
jgi:hypothetical protein